MQIDLIREYVAQNYMGLIKYKMLNKFAKKTFSTFIMLKVCNTRNIRLRLVMLISKILHRGTLYNIFAHIDF